MIQISQLNRNYINTNNYKVINWNNNKFINSDDARDEEADEIIEVRNRFDVLSLNEDTTTQNNFRDSLVESAKEIIPKMP